MKFEYVIQLARDTPTGVLCEAWGADAAHVASAKKGERPMSLREAGALADVHGLKLLDVLTV